MRVRNPLTVMQIRAEPSPTRHLFGMVRTNNQGLPDPHSGGRPPGAGRDAGVCRGRRGRRMGSPARRQLRPADPAPIQHANNQPAAAERA